MCLVTGPCLTVAVLSFRPFFGTTTEETVSHQIALLWEILGETDSVRSDNYMVAVYENPGVHRRRNEIWFIRQDL